jgi:hypothetical protein
MDERPEDTRAAARTESRAGNGAASPGAKKQDPPGGHGFPADLRFKPY